VVHVDRDNRIVTPGAEERNPAESDARPTLPKVG
jgi:hypothetical protein